MDYIMNRKAPIKAQPRGIIIDGETVDEQTFDEFRRCIKNWYRESRFGQLFDEFIERRRNDQQPPKIDAPPAPEPEIEEIVCEPVPDAPEHNNSVPELSADKWAFGMMPDGTVLYLSAYWIGHSAAKLVLLSRGCVKIGQELHRLMPESELLGRFRLRGWTRARRLRECESIADAVDLGFLRIGKRA